MWKEPQLPTGLLRCRSQRQRSLGQSSRRKLSVQTLGVESSTDWGVRARMQGTKDHATRREVVRMKFNVVHDRKLFCEGCNTQTIHQSERAALTDGGNAYHFTCRACGKWRLLMVPPPQGRMVA